MAKKISIAVFSDRLIDDDDNVADVTAALQDGGFFILEVREREKTKQGKYVTWFSVEKGEMAWCNVCEAKTITHRGRCETCGAKRGSY